MSKFFKWLAILAGSFIVCIAFFFALFYFTAGGSKSVPLTVTEDSTLPSITVKNIKLHCETFGDPQNETVIVLHGGPGGDYRGLLSLASLSNEFFIVFYDQRGCGLSERVDDSLLSLEGCLEELHEIIQFFGKGKKVSLIGHSWGAMLASGYLAAHPHNIRRIVLAEPGFLTTETAETFMNRSHGMMPEMNLNVIKFFAAAFFQSLHVSGKDGSMDYLLGQIMSYSGEENPMALYFCDGKFPGNVKFWRIGSRAMQSIPSKGMVNGKLRIDLVSGVEKFSDFVLFIASECNKLIGEDIQKIHMKYFRYPELVVIKNSGHLMFEENPTDSVGVVRKYLKK